MNARNPVTTLGFARLHFAKNNFTSAKEYIQSTKDIDPDGISGEQAEELLQKIEASERESGTLNMTGTIQ